MDLSTNYTKTGRGLRAQIKKLPPNAGQILFAMNTTSSGGELHSKLRKMNIKDFDLAISWLLEGGYIRVVSTEPFSNSVWAPVTQSAIQVSEISFDEFNQTIKATIAEAIEALVKTSNEQETTKETKLDSAIVSNIETNVVDPVVAKAKLNTEIKDKTEALTKADTEARERAETQSKRDVDAKVAKETKSKAEAQAKLEVEAKEKALAEAAKEAKAEAQAKIEAELEAKAKAKAVADALAKADEEARERAEAQS